jgi:hypothetical protein
VFQDGKGGILQQGAGGAVLGLGARVLFEPSRLGSSYIARLSLHRDRARLRRASILPPEAGSLFSVWPKKSNQKRGHPDAAPFPFVIYKPLCGGEGWAIRPAGGSAWMPIPFRQGRSPVEKPGRPSRTCGAKSPASAKRGALSFGYFSLSKQRKVTRPPAGGRKLAAGEQGLSNAPKGRKPAAGEQGLSNASNEATRQKKNPQ